MVVRYFYPESAADGIAPWAGLKFIVNDYNLALTFSTPKMANKHKVLDDQRSGAFSPEHHIGIFQVINVYPLKLPSLINPS